MRQLKLFSVVLFLVAVYGSGLLVNSECSFETCPQTKEGHTNVHLVPFSVEELYLDYDDVIASLKINEKRKFTFNEVSPFWNWWLKQNSKAQDSVISLINNGQIEWAGGGWTINDEAVTMYQSIIDQMTWGLRKLNNTFGACGQPKVGWQYGVFGHSKQMANIFAHLGYEGIIIGQIGSDEKKNRTNDRTLELIWQGSKTLGSTSNIFTSIVYEDFNKFKTELDVGVEKFLYKVQKAAQHYRTTNILVPLGSDQSTTPSALFKNIDSIYSYLRKQPDMYSNINIMYSTPSCYLQAVHKDNNGLVKGTVKQDDFLPYSNDSDHYFTGYYTSNPNLKRFERLGNNFLQICKQLGALVPVKNLDKIDSLRQAMGDIQRVNGITGTGTKDMQDKYSRKLFRGFEDCLEIVQDALRMLTHDKKTEYEECTLHLNITECETSEKNDNFIVTTYNPLSKTRTKFVRLPVSGNAYRVRGSDGVDLPTQIAPIPFPEMPGRTGKTKKKLLFPAKDIPPMGFKTFYVERIDKDDNSKIPFKSSEGVTEVKNKDVGFKINPKTGLLSHFSAYGIDIDFTQRFYYTKDMSSFPLDNETARQFASYTFEPEEPPVETTDKVEYKLYQGPIVQELHQRVNSYIRNVFRVYTNETGIEAQWFIGPIPSNGRGTDVFTKFITNLSTNNTFYTDSNGRDTIPRHKTEKSSPTLTQAASYYPTTSLINLKDDAKSVELGVLVDRGQGGTSLKDGEIELMLDRRFAFEPTNDPPKREDYVEGLTFIILAHTLATKEQGKTSKDFLRLMIDWKLFDTWFFVSSTNGLSYHDFKMQHNMAFQGMTHALPENIKVMTLEPWEDGFILLRLVHLISTGDVPDQEAIPERINIKNLFSTFQVTAVRETTVGANQWLDQQNRLKFRSVLQNNTKNYDSDEELDDDYLQDFIVTLYPMQIRTFIVEVCRE